MYIHLMKNPTILIPLFLAPLAHAATTSIVFDSSYDLYRDFRITGNAPGLTSIQDSGNTYVRHTGVNTQSSFIYDTNGAAPGVTTFAISIGESLTVSTSIRFSGAPDSGNNSSFGFIFGNGTTNHLALVNFNQSNFNELLRTFTGTGLDGNAGTADTTTLNGFNAIALNTFTTVSATYTALSATQYKVGITVGTNTLETTYNAAPLANLQVGMRLNNSGTERFVDVNIVPEPGVSALAIGSLGLLALRRRR